MNKSAVLLIVVLSAVPYLVRAADQKFPVAGLGTISCGKWIESRALKDKNIDSMFTSWIQGFLSGMNTSRRMQTNQEMSLIPDPPTVLAYVDKYCRENPLKEVYSASMQLYHDMQKP